MTVTDMPVVLFNDSPENPEEAPFKHSALLCR